ncbi:MAG: ABC transporter permease [Chloroflexia bacterium]|jgi:peptide/nickel transport system permease protein|nr:ABC transporter permease [Chloroflexia bacterium]MDQ3613257.1 ABC transporter permease [Chloroflexota bacterium]
MQRDSVLRLESQHSSTGDVRGGSIERHRHPRFQSVLSLLPLLPLLSLVAIAVVGPLVIVADPDEQELLIRLQPPAWAGGSWDHPLGTDGLGRDLLARVAEGARFSLLIGVIAAVNAGVIGVMLGAFAGLAGGWIDRIITSLVTVEMAIPGIVIGIVITATLGQGLLNLIVILLLGGWIVYARIVRLQALALRQSEFVEAAHALGAGRFYVLRRHMLPNLAPTILVLFAQGIAAVMVYEATLTYLGLGLPIESVTLGSLVREGQQVVFSAWWAGLFPGLMIALAVVGFNFLADWIQARMRIDRIADM